MVTLTHKKIGFCLRGNADVVVHGNITFNAF